MKRGGRESGKQGDEWVDVPRGPILRGKTNTTRSGRLVESEVNLPVSAANPAAPWECPVPGLHGWEHCHWIRILEAELAAEMLNRKRLVAQTLRAEKAEARVRELEAGR